jgi:hypothetical protein
MDAVMNPTAPFLSDEVCLRPLTANGELDQIIFPYSATSSERDEDPYFKDKVYFRLECILTTREKTLLMRCFNVEYKQA